MVLPVRYLTLVICILSLLLFVWLFSEPSSLSEGLDPLDSPPRSRRARPPRPSPPDVDQERPWFDSTRPITREQLGRRAWGVLHTMAAMLTVEEGETETQKVQQVLPPPPPSPS